MDSRYATEFVVGLEENAGTPELTPGVVGQLVGLTFEQNGIGGFSYEWPVNCAFDGVLPPLPVTAPSNRQSCRFMWNGSFWEQWGPVLNVLPPSLAFVGAQDDFSSGNPFWLSTPSTWKGHLWEHVPGGGSLGIQPRSGQNVGVVNSLGWVGDNGPTAHGWSHGKLRMAERCWAAPGLTPGNPYTLRVESTSAGFEVTVDQTTPWILPVSDMEKWRPYTKHGIVASDTKAQFTEFSVT